jgi:glutamine cyclotransferase
MRFSIFIYIILILNFFSCGSQKNERETQLPNKTNTNKLATSIAQDTGTKPIMPLKPNIKLIPKVIRTIDHEPGSFTQGLIYCKGFLYESTGLRGESTLRKLDTKTGKVLKRIDLPAEYFGEGITIFNDKIYMLTWLSNLCFVYDLKTFDLEGSFNYYGEGWGLTSDGKLLIMSDGSNSLRFINPEDFQVVRTINVYDNNTPLKNLNELEYINGVVFANIWMEDRIAMIDPSSGELNGTLDMSFLRKYIKDSQNIDVLNGIAYDTNKDTYYFTGKYWPYIFEVKMEEGK